MSHPRPPEYCSPQAVRLSRPQLQNTRLHVTCNAITHNRPLADGHTDTHSRQEGLLDAGRDALRRRDKRVKPPLRPQALAQVLERRHAPLLERDPDHGVVPGRACAHGAVRHPVPRRRRRERADEGRCAPGAAGA